SGLGDVPVPDRCRASGTGPWLRGRLSPHHPNLKKRGTTSMFKSLLCAATFGVAVASATLATAAEVTIRFPNEYSLEITPGRANAEFKRLVEERSEGRVEVQLYPSGSLYKGLDLVQAILRGDAEMTTLIQAYWS